MSTISENEPKKEELHYQPRKSDIFWRFFTLPSTNPIELYIVGSLYEKTQYYGPVFSQDELSLIISGALFEAQGAGRDLSSSPSSEKSYLIALTGHNFLYYDSKTKLYCLTQPGLMLGQSLWQLRDPKFLNYDEQYLEDVITEIRSILEDWSKRIIELSEIIDSIPLEQYTEIKHIFDQMLKKEQQLMNFNQLQIQVVDLSHQAIDIAENLKKITSQLQVDYIEGVHQKRDTMVIRERIDRQIEKYEGVIERLNQKNQDISKLIQKNRKNIERIEQLAEELRFRFDSLSNQKFRYPETNREREIQSSLSRLISICARLEDFASQLHRTVFDITLKRVNTVRYIFKHLQELIQNTQLLGDLYNVWRIGIFQNLTGIRTVNFAVLNSLRTNIWTQRTIDHIPIEEFRLSFMTDEKIIELKQKINERNQNALKQYEEATESTVIRLEVRSQWELLINKILKRVEHSTGLVDLNQVIFELSRDSRFSSANNYPRLLSIVWEQLTKRYKICTIIEQTDNEDWSEKIYEFEGGRLVRVRAPKISITRVGEIR